MTDASVVCSDVDPGVMCIVPYLRDLEYKVHTLKVFKIYRPESLKLVPQLSNALSR